MSEVQVTVTTKSGISYTAIFFLAFLLALALAACTSESSPRGELGANQELLKSCNPAAPPASLIQIDGTGSSNSEAIVSERLTAVEAVTRRTAVCSGYLRVGVFSSSSAATRAPKLPR